MSHLEINVTPETLKRCGLKAVIARQSASDSEIFNLLKTIHHETSSHSWKCLSFSSSEGMLRQLVEFEAKKRPTKFFFYHGVNHDGSSRLIAIGTVAYKISNGFVHEGFPVIARCYIDQDFRNYRLYKPILVHRFEHCREHFGPALKCIHLGSDNPRIFSAIKKDYFGIPFLYVGDEDLELASGTSLVRDFVWLTPEVRSQLYELAGVCANNPTTSRLSDLLIKLLQNLFSGADYGELCKTVSQLQVSHDFTTNQCFHQLLDVMSLLKHIPVREVESKRGIEDLEVNKRAA